MDTVDHKTKIKSMKLYRHSERIFNELKELGYSDPSSPIKLSDLTKLDQLHYHGTAALDSAINILNITSSSAVCDVGSGVGGPARYLSQVTGCHVTAVEIQEDLNSVGRKLTERTGLSDRVRHVTGDVLHVDLGPPGQFDVCVGILTFLHISDKASLMSKLSSLLKKDGVLYGEVLYKAHNGPLSTKYTQMLEQDLYCHDLLDKDGYRMVLENNGLSVVQMDDLTESWKSFVNERHEAYIASKDRHVRVHCEEWFNEQEAFYRAVVTLFNDGVFGGARLVAKKA